MALGNLASKAAEKAKAATATLTEKFTSLKEDVFSDDQQSIIDTFKDAGADKVKSILEDIDNSSSAIHAVGYNLESVEISLGIPPDVVMLFKYEKSITKNELEKVLEGVGDRKILRIVLKGLFHATTFFEAVKVGSYKMKEVKIDLGLIPKVSISFTRGTGDA